MYGRVHADGCCWNLSIIQICMIRTRHGGHLALIGELRYDLIHGMAMLPDASFNWRNLTFHAFRDQLPILFLALQNWTLDNLYLCILRQPKHVRILKLMGPQLNPFLKFLESSFIATYFFQIHILTWSNF